MKIDMIEILESKNILIESREKIEWQIQEAKTMMNDINESESLSGNVKEAINGDITNHQLPLLTNYSDAIFYVTTEFKKMIKDFQSTVEEKSTTARIDTDSLASVEEKFPTQKERVITANVEANDAYIGIRAIVQVYTVKPDEFIEQLNQAKEVLSNTQKWMSRFNSQKLDTKVSDIISKQNKELDALGSLAKLGYTSPEALTLFSNVDFKRKSKEQHEIALEDRKLEFNEMNPDVVAIGEALNEAWEWRDTSDFKSLKNLLSMLTFGVTKEDFYKYGKVGALANATIVYGWEYVKNVLLKNKLIESSIPSSLKYADYNSIAGEIASKVKWIKPFSETAKWWDNAGASVVKKVVKSVSKSKFAGPLAGTLGWALMAASTVYSGVEAYNDKDGKAYHNVGKAIVHAGVDTLKGLGPLGGAITLGAAGLSFGPIGGLAGGIVGGLGGLVNLGAGILDPDGKDAFYDYIEDKGNSLVDDIDDGFKEIGKASKEAWGNIKSFFGSVKYAFG